MLNYEAYEKKYSLGEQTAKGWGHFSTSVPSKTFRFLVGIIILAFIIAPALGSIVWVFSSLLSGNIESILVAIFISSMFWVLIALIFFSFVRTGKKRLAAEKFCQDNNFKFTPFMTVKDEKGALFQKGDSRLASNGISGVINGNGFILFDYRFMTGSGKNRATHYFKVVKIRLAKKFPHIFLDNKRDGSLGALEFDRSQKLTLEGDFNQYFSVYGPKEYEIEVLQILNPLVMQTLIDIKEPVDIEILNDNLYIYDKGQKIKKETMQALFHAVETIVDSTENTERTFSMAEQIGTNKPVLKRSIWPAIAFAFFIIFWILAQFLPFLLGD